MKKILSILMAGLLLLSASLVTSCSEEDVEYLAPSGTWCEMPVDWDGDGSSNMYVYMIYNDSTISGETGSAKLLTTKTFESGITMVVFAKANIESLNLNAGSYIVKTFPKDSDTTNLDDNDTSWSFKGSRAKWAAIYWSKSALRDTSNQLAHPLAPTPITNGNKGTYAELTDLTELKNFSWKKLLANYLLNSL
ncbi:MAG: hypothetical protein IJ630_11815 [Treponema sp.]|nr:hypothetical protein [Treponema sp.]